MIRTDGRKWDEMRQIKITRDFVPSANGSALIEMGNTRVICTASLEDGVPPFLRNSGKGWLTAEYAMLPMSTPGRNKRESATGKIKGRTHEIQRLIGRSLRAVTDLSAFGERTIFIDCDVIQADGGTRTASITGGFIALVEALRRLKEQVGIEIFPVKDFISAISVGIVGGTVLLDLNYREDSSADVDMNFVITGSGGIVEVQGTAEAKPFSRDMLNKMTDIATTGIFELIKIQKDILGDI
ncbi:MAG TPA: ribonuclease PH [Syntrophales bacterium]|nr:ribonuclease PH [Syntrophales bacterium]HPQ44114.1 ribonuclease PH [Syntrophales bacterium]